MKQLVPYLARQRGAHKGITLFLLWLSVGLWSPLVAQEYFYRQFAGTLGDQRVRVTLIKAPSRDNFQFNLRGEYYDVHSKTLIALNHGHLDPVGNLYMEEGILRPDSYRPTEKVFVRTGQFAGKYYPEQQRIEGVRHSTDGQHTTPFAWYEDYSNGALAAEIVFNDLRYEAAEIRFHYPYFKGRPSAQVINRFIQEDLLGNMQLKMTEFIDSYQEAKSLGGMVDAYSSSQIVYIHHNEGDVLGIEYKIHAYNGGPHEEYKKLFFTFDLQNGEPIGLNKLLLPGFERALGKLLDQKLRHQFAIRGHESLASFGFTLPESGMYPSKNFYLDREGIGFYYNVYEIAPYAVGAIELRVTYEEIASWIAKNGPIAYLFEK